MWMVDTTRIYVQEYQTDTKQIIARLNPLGGGTVHHLFGYEDPIAKLEGYVVGFDRVNLLRNMTNDGDLHFLTTPYASGYFYINSMSEKPTPTLYQTLDITRDCEEPVFIVNLELYYNA